MTGGVLLHRRRCAKSAREHADDMDRLSARTIGDLVPAARPVGNDDRRGVGLTHGGVKA